MESVVQMVERRKDKRYKTKSKQFFLYVPSALVREFKLEKGQVMLWDIRDRNTIILTREKTKET